MSTTVSLSLYAAFVAWRWWQDRVEKRHRMEIAASSQVEIVDLRARIIDIEDTLSSTPFVTFKKP